MTASLGATVPPVSRDVLNRETNARFWAQSGYKPGKRLDPNNPLDKAKMPVWMDIFRKVTSEADAGTLVTTYDRSEVAQPLADAVLASTVTAVHVDAAKNAPDPTTAQQHTAAAVTATQVASQKLNEAASNQPPTVSSRLEEISAREAAKTPPPPHAPAADHIAHAQTQNGKNGQFLRPEDDPWDPRYAPKSKSPREQPPAQPSKSPRERPSREILYKETNARFWNRTRYKPGQRLDMSDPQDQEMSKTWMDIFREVQREANEGRLAFTSPELVPTPNGARPPPPWPTPPPTLPRPIAPPPQQPMPPPGMQQPGMPMPMQQPGMPMPGMPQPGMPMQPWGPPGMQQPGMPMQPRMPVQPQMPMKSWPPPGMQQPGRMRPGMPMQPGMQPGMQPPSAPPIPAEGGPPPPSPTEGALPPQSPEGGLPSITTEAAPAEGMSTKAKIALAVLGLGGLAGIAYAVTRKSSPPSRPRARTSARVAPTSATASSAFPRGRF